MDNRRYKLKLYRTFGSILLYVMAITIVFALPKLPQNAFCEYTPPQVISLDSLRAASSKPLRIHFHRGFPRSISFDVLASDTNAQEHARNFLTIYAPLYLQDNADMKLNFARADQVAEGYEIVRVSQTFRGVPIFGSEIVVHLVSIPGIPSRVVFTSGALLTPTKGDRDPVVMPDIDLIPAITPEMAEDIAKNETDCPGASIGGRTALLIYDPFVFGETSDPRLVWRVTVGNCSAENVLVDANTGEVVAQRALTQTFDLDLEDANGENMVDTYCYTTTTMDDQIGDE